MSILILGTKNDLLDSNMIKVFDNYLKSIIERSKMHIDYLKISSSWRAKNVFEDVFIGLKIDSILFDQIINNNNV